MNFRLQYFYYNDTFIQYLRVSEFQRQRPSIFYLTTVYLIRCQPTIDHSECSCGLPESVLVSPGRKISETSIYYLIILLSIEIDSLIWYAQHSILLIKVLFLMEVSQITPTQNWGYWVMNNTKSHQNFQTGPGVICCDRQKCFTALHYLA